jgi:hypothetical protein
MQPGMKETIKTAFDVPADVADRACEDVFALPRHVAREPRERRKRRSSGGSSSGSRS